VGRGQIMKSETC